MHKKTLLFVVFTAILFMGFIMFYGCDKSTDNSDENGDTGPPKSLIGSWNLISVTAEVNDQVVTVAPSLLGLTMTLVVRSDDTFEATVTVDDSTETLTGTYTKTANSVTMNFSNGATQTSPYHFEGEILVIEGIIPWDLDDDGTPENIPATLKYARQSS